MKKYLFCAFLSGASPMNPGTWEILYLIIAFYTTILAASLTTNFLMSAFERTRELMIAVDWENDECARYFRSLIRIRAYQVSGIADCSGIVRSTFSTLIVPCLLLSLKSCERTKSKSCIAKHVGISNHLPAF